MDAGPCQLRARGAGALSVSFGAALSPNAAPRHTAQLSSEGRSQLWVESWPFDRCGRFGWKADINAPAVEVFIRFAGYASRESEIRRTSLKMLRMEWARPEHPKLTSAFHPFLPLRSRRQCSTHCRHLELCWCG
jgi:hypothetical protein